MNPLRLTATNYRSFETLDLGLPSGCLAIVGENGAGKSSIVNVIDLALFGARNLGDYLTEDVIEEDMTLALEFEHSGQLYRVRRTYSPRGRGSAKLDFEKGWSSSTENGHGLTASTAHSAGWEPLTRENAGATQELIEQTLGLSRETFRASAFLAQGDGAAFTETQPRERKAILAEVLSLDVWDRLLDRARIDRREVETELQQFAGRIEVAEHELEQRAQIVSERDSHAVVRTEAAEEHDLAAEAAAAVEQRLAEARERAAARSAAEQLANLKGEAVFTAQEQLRKLASEETEIRRSLAEKPDLLLVAPKVESLEAELELARQAQQRRIEHARLVVERNRLLGEANELNEQAHALRIKAGSLEEHGSAIAAGVCEVCGQTLGAEARKTSIETWRERADTIDAQAAERDQAAQAIPVSAAADRVAAVAGARELAAIETELVSVRRANERLAALAELEKRLEAIVAEVEATRGSIPTLEREKDEAYAALDELQNGAKVEELERALAAARHRVEQARSRISSLDQAVARCDERLERLAKLEADVAETREKIAALQNRVDLLALAEKAYGRDGIPALIVENAAIPQIEAEASRILGELGTPFRVELRTQRALKSGEGVRDTLDIVICSPAGERPYETFSGGERTRLNLALRIALARLLAHRRGAESRLLVIDEPDGLDEAGMQALAEVLQGLSGDFDRVVLISHVPALATAFDQTLTVVKEGDRSRIVDGVASDAETRAEVAA